MKRLLVAVAVLLFANAAAAQVSIGAAWIREPNPARDLTAGFMSLTNHGDKEVSLVRAVSDAAKVVELHEMQMADGMMKMRQVERIAIAPKTTVKLEPGGLHLMLIGLSGPLADGDTVAMTLEFDDGTQAVIEAQVRKPEAAKHDHAH
ncbi:MAG TPA: copper chaperone PCu(A)C [Thermoanaerobaculia bacterium]